MGNNRRTKVKPWLKVVFYFLNVIAYHVNSQDVDPQVNVTYITDAVAKGAVCLDGSPGAYYFAKGFEDGVDNWIIYLPGGAWCNSKNDCLERSRGGLGSSKRVPTIKNLYPIQSSIQRLNPDFYNWNKVDIKYCDGASFMADVEAVDPETKVYLRGRRIFNSVMEELMAKGMTNASKVLLIGNSAGGLATILNCDHLRSFLPTTCRLKCLSDSGFFIHAKDLPGAESRESFFANVTAFHELAQTLPSSCTQRMAPGLCLFPENVVKDIQAPLFLLNSDFDLYQISKLLLPNPHDVVGWEHCTTHFTSLQNCTANQLQLITDFRTAFLKTLEGLDDNPSRGFFINSCYIHDLVVNQNNLLETPILQNKTIQQAIGDWYFERSTSVQIIDTQHPYPINCNNTEIGGPLSMSKFVIAPTCPSSF